MTDVFLMERPRVALDTFPSDLGVYESLLLERFGYRNLHAGQAEALTRLASGDALVVMPTGGGKSMCYVLPALVVGRTVVVSPLIALMHDQVESLKAHGVRAAAINSHLDQAQQNRRYLDFVHGDLDILYVAPERFANDRFVAGLRRAGVHLLAIDEAHCVSEWGHDFRPDYLTLGSARERLGLPRTLALTATADPRVRNDILQRLGIEDAAEVITSVDRPNLRLGVVHASSVDDRKEWLLRYLGEHDGECGIVYVRTRLGVEDLAEMLHANGVGAAGYHAGMSREQRTAVQRRFTLGELPVIVATNAFGMGIDKPDVRFVVHFNMPGSIEAYYQEAGRAGRDGDPAECTLLYARRDATAHQSFIDRDHPGDNLVRVAWRRLVHASRASPPTEPGASAAGSMELDGFAMTLSALRASGLVEPSGRDLLSLDADAPIDTSAIAQHRRYAEDRLRQMREYAGSSECRRAAILRYFGEEAADRCDGCDNCSPSKNAGAYPGDLCDAVMALREQLARRFDREPDRLFRERTAEEIALYRPHTQDELMEIWGIKHVNAGWFGDDLLQAVRAWEQEHPDAPARPIKPVKPEGSVGKRRTREEKPHDDVPLSAGAEELFERLRQWRLDQAREQGVAAYVIFSDRTLRDLATQQPQDQAALRRVWGMGEVKCGRYGEQVLRLVCP